MDLLLRWLVFRSRRKSDTSTRFLLELARCVAGAPRGPDSAPLLEIGTRAGGSALLMLRVLDACYPVGMRRPLVVTVDPYGTRPYEGAPFQYDERHYGAMKRALARHSNHIHYMMDSELFLQLRSKLYLWIDGARRPLDRFLVVYLDGSHDPDVVWREIEGLLPLVVPGGFLIVDDTDWFDGAVRRRLDAAAPRLPGTVRHHGKQSVIAVKPGIAQRDSSPSLARAGVTATGRWIRAHPVAAYFLLACAISWIAVSPLVAAWLGLVGPIAPSWHWVGALGPITAAVTVTFLIAGRDGVRDLWRRMTRGRVGARSWLLALGSSIGLGILAAALLRAFGRPWPDLALLKGALADSGWVANLVAASVAYGIGEEPGWRGFALPRLQAQRSAFRATLILTVLWATWHAPYFTYRYHIVGLSGYAGFFTCFVAGAIWLTFLYNSSRDSVLLLMLWHTLWNVANVGGAALSSELVAVMNVLMIPLGITALIIGGPRRLSWPRPEATRTCP